MKHVNIESVLNEMGKAVDRYIKVYKKTLKNQTFEMENFKVVFKEYLEHRHSKSKDGYARISPTSFSFYLGGSDLEEIMQNIEEANNKEDDHDFY